MKHTEESLMALVWDAIDGIPVCAVDEKPWNPLRLAIREVLAENTNLRNKIKASGRYKLKQRAERAEALERAAVCAWSTGINEHNKAAGLPCDARTTGSRCAEAIRAIIKEYK